MENNRNLFITIAASVLILTLWQVFYMNPRIESERKAAEIEAARVEQQKKDRMRCLHLTRTFGKRTKWLILR